MVNPETSQVIVSYNNPQMADPAVKEAQKNHAETVQNLQLIQWAEYYFEHHKLKDTLNFEQAIEAAKTLNAPDLFNTAYAAFSDAEQRQAAVAGVAAVVISENVTEHLKWAIEICLLAAVMPEILDAFCVRETVLINHPVLFATRGLGALFNSISIEDVAPLQTCLTKLAAHYYEAISVAALEGLFGAWKNIQMWPSQRCVLPQSLRWWMRKTDLCPMAGECKNKHMLKKFSRPR